MKKTLFILLFFIANIHLFAGGINLPMGAKQAGVGNAAVATCDVWSVYHNQAGLAGVEQTTASIFVSQGNLLSQSNQAALAYAIPTKLGTFAFSFNRFGYKLYNENKAGFAYARKFGDGLRIGAQANVNSLAIGENYGKKIFLTFEAGLQFKLMNNLWLGTHIYNFSRASINTIEKVPVIVRFGLYYKINSAVDVTVEYEKNWIQKPLFKGGVEYRLVKDFALRTGINAGSNVSTFFGAGYVIKQFSIDAACAFDAKLGTTPQINLNYKF